MSKILVYLKQFRMEEKYFAWGLDAFFSSFRDSKTWTKLDSMNSLTNSAAKHQSPNPRRIAEFTSKVVGGQDRKSFTTNAASQNQLPIEATGCRTR